MRVMIVVMVIRACRDWIGDFFAWGGEGAHVGVVEGEVDEGGLVLWFGLLLSLKSLLWFRWLPCAACEKW